MEVKMFKRHKLSVNHDQSFFFQNAPMFTIQATGSCHSQHHQEIAVKKWVVPKTLHPQKENRHTFLTNMSSGNFSQKLITCLEQVVYLDCSERLITSSVHEIACSEHVVYTNCFFVFVLAFRTI